MEDNGGYRMNSFPGEEKPLHNSQQAEKTCPEGIQRVHHKMEITGEPQNRKTRLVRQC